MSIPWLKELEDRVQETASRLVDMRAENETLQGRLAELEEELAAVPDAKQGEAWAEEKAEIRQRVEKLAEHLENLLKDD